MIPYLHQASRHITRLGSFDSGIYQSLTTTHGMEKELCSSQPSVKRIGHKPFGRRGQTVVFEMWKRAIDKAILDTQTSNGLLTYTRNHLGNIQRTSFRSTLCHDSWRIRPGQAFHRFLTCRFTKTSENTVKHLFEGLQHVATRSQSQLSLLVELYESLSLSKRLTRVAILEKLVHNMPA